MSYSSFWKQSAGEYRFRGLCESENDRVVESVNERNFRLAEVE